MNIQEFRQLREDLEYADRLVGGPENHGGMSRIIAAAQAFVDGRLIDRQTLDYEAAANELREHLKLGPTTARLWVTRIIDAAVGEGEQ